jgi:hypothetical protein
MGCEEAHPHIEQPSKYHGNRRIGCVPTTKHMDPRDTSVSTTRGKMGAVCGIRWCSGKVIKDGRSADFLSVP